MKRFDLTLRVAGATLVLLVLHAISSHAWTGAQLSFWLGLPALSSLLVVLALALVAVSSQQEGWKLSGTIFILYFGINYLNTLDDALLFKVGLQPSEVFRLMASGFFTALIFSPLLVLILGCWKNDRQEEPKPLVPRSAGSWVGRIVLGDFLYIFCYIVAGIAVSPYIRDFYGNIALPAPLSIVAMEVFRGLVYVAAGLAVTHGMKGTRGRAAAALGLSFPILAGVAPLLFPNPYLPGYVRMAHAFEIGVSNLVYGAVLGFLLTRKAAPGITREQVESTEPFA